MATRRQSGKTKTKTAKTARVEVKSESRADRKSRGTMEPAKGKLGVMIPGMGAVATTFVAGVEAIRKGLAAPIGSLTQMGTVRLGKRTESRAPQVKEFVPLAGVEVWLFPGGHIFEVEMSAPARTPGARGGKLLKRVRPFFISVKPR